VAMKVSRPFGTVPATSAQTISGVEDSVLGSAFGLRPLRIQRPLFACHRPFLSLHCRPMKLLLPALLGLAVGTASAAEIVPLTALDLSKMHQGYGKPQIDRSIREKPLSIAGEKFQHGVGTHANSTLWIDLSGGSDRFQAAVGLDDSAGPGSVTFKVLGDGKRLWESPVMKTGQAAQRIDLDVKGLKTLTLLVGNAGDGMDFDHGDWADARFVVSGTKPKAIDRPNLNEPAVILTPKPAAAPKINGPRVVGCRPGNPFVFRVPTTGTRPIEFAADGLPASLILDPATGILTGTVPPRGEYKVTLKAKNEHGATTALLRIRAGDTLALTPPMGWNHWYTHYDRVTDALMREAADVMVRSGMADVGYQYVSIDDCWMNARNQSDPLRVGPARDAQGNILPNRHFPDMKAMTDYIHSKGLRAGIYTGPGPTTCAGFTATYQHEEQDARQFADWGFDFLKYDWCSYGDIAAKETGPELEKLQKPYRLMGDILKRQHRDIVFNLCQYGMGKVWEWGEAVGGHCWRTAGDLGFELDRVFEVALANAAHRQWSKPGAWNDPDYIQIGFIGDARGMGQPKPCPLSPNEQYSFMSLWCLMASPLFYSGHMGVLDEFTINVLCNPEVIDVDQDPLGQSAAVVTLGEDTFLMVKSLEDGSRAVGLFNRGELATTVTAKWSDLGVSGKQRVRDLWRQRDLEVADSDYRAVVPRHGVVLLRLTSVQQ
jgi:alpha-galactosidase